MTVEELVAELNKLPSFWKVYIEGCDCIGEAADVISIEDSVLITRALDV
jgi:hypothetical protein